MHEYQNEQKQKLPPILSAIITLTTIYLQQFEQNDE